MGATAHSFADFSTRVYRQPGVADACLFIQERYGLNVNLVLFCIWVADRGGGALTAGQVDTAMRRVIDWEERVIAPLRAIRQTCRSEALGVPEFLLQMFAPQIEMAELGAAQVERLVLASLAPEPGPATGAADAAVRSLDIYVGKLGIAPDAQLAECLTAILQAVFSGARYAANRA